MLEAVLESTRVSVMTSWFRSVLEALSREMRSGCPELFFADDLTLVSLALKEAWKGKEHWS